MMEKVDIKSGEVIAKEAAFHSKTEVNLESTEVDFCKLMNNSVFGKTLENIRNRADIRIISTDKVAQKLAARQNYDCCTTSMKTSFLFI